MAKATHSGHCQACGNLQKLPSGRLAKHGYTVAQGYFSGVCRGSGFQPFEVSYDQVERYIAEAKSSLTGVETFQKFLRTPQPEPSAWFYTSKASPKGSGYQRNRVWEKCEITQEIVTYEDGSKEGGSYSKFSRNGDTRWVSSRDEKGSLTAEVRAVRSEISADYQATLADVAREANEDYAEWLEAEAKSLRRYIAWQEERVRTWTPGTLLPVDAKDKAGFKPDEPRY